VRWSRLGCLLLVPTAVLRPLELRRRVGGCMDGLEFSARDLGVDLGRLEPGITEHRLDETHGRLGYRVLHLDAELVMRDTPAAVALIRAALRAAAASE